jgi:very-short-patch-repair endonuclease
MKKHPIPGAHMRARSLRHNMTDAERRLWRTLRLRQMGDYKFRRQVPLGRYIADFVCHEARLIVEEVDGGQHDAFSLGEIGRTRFLESEGYRILRFWNNEVLENLDGVYSTIATELGRTLEPSPSMEGVNSFTESDGITPTLPHQGGGRHTRSGVR